MSQSTNGKSVTLLDENLGLRFKGEILGLAQHQIDFGGKTRGVCRHAATCEDVDVDVAEHEVKQLFSGYRVTLMYGRFDEGFKFVQFIFHVVNEKEELIAEGFVKSIDGGEVEGT